MRVYMAGPYSADNVMGVLRNMGAGMRDSERVFAAGHSPFVPWFDYQFEMFADHGKECYYSYSMTWLEVSEVVVLVGKWKTSPGTIKEVKRAVELGIPVYENVDLFLKWNKPMELEQIKAALKEVEDAEA